MVRLALADVAGLNGADAAAVGAAFRDVFESFAVRAKLRREKLGEFARKFDASVEKLASAGAPLVPPVEVPPMSQPQSDAISGVFDSTVGTSAGAPDFMTAAEFASLLSAAGLVDDDSAPTPSRSPSAGASAVSPAATRISHPSSPRSRRWRGSGG